MSLELRHLTVFDPELKDYDWINQMVSHYRGLWQPVVDTDRVRTGMQYLFGVQDMKIVRDMFTDPSKAGVKFYPVAILEKTVNIFLSEVLEDGIHLHFKATDPTAFNQVTRDKMLLTNRRLVESIISKEQMSIGGPAYRMTDDKDKDGAPLFNGNIPEFDELGLDENSSEDVGYFFQFFHRLDHEVRAEEVTNAYFRNSEVIATVEEWVYDILSKGAIAGRTYVSDITGAIENKYVSPEKMRVVKGSKDDFKDALAQGNEDEVTVAEFLRMVGNDFDPEADMSYMLQAVNSVSSNLVGGIPYTGIESGGALLCGTTDKTIPFQTFNTLKVSMGYIEFKTNDATAFKKAKKNYHGNVSVRRLKNPTETVHENSKYQKETYYNEKIYKAYFVSTGAFSQHLFKAGPLNWQQVEGADDEIAGFTSWVVLKKGPTFVEAVSPIVDMWQKSFAKMEFEINRAKPQGRAYFYDSLIAIAENMLPKDPGRSKMAGIMEVVRMFAESPNEIYTIPEINGNPAGGGGVSSHELKNGLTENFAEWRNTLQMCDQLVDRIVGISPERGVYAPQAREVKALHENSTNYSEKATQYLPRMVSKGIIHFSNSTIRFAQDIVYFGNKTMAYRYMTRMLGDENTESLKRLGKISLHRYSIFPEWYNLRAERQEIKIITIQAQQNKEITAEQAVLVNSIISPKRAAQTLAMQKKMTERKNAKIIEAQNTFSMQLEDKKFQNEVFLKKLDIQGKILERDTQGRWLKESYAQNNEAMLQKQEMKVDGDTAKIQAKAEAEIMTTEAEANVGAQAPAPIGL